MRTATANTALATNLACLLLSSPSELARGSLRNALHRHFGDGSAHCTSGTMQWVRREQASNIGRKGRAEVERAKWLRLSAIEMLLSGGS
jgi:hypothetical protein